MKRIFYLLIFCFSICFAQAQGVHIYKSNGDYEVIRDFDLDSIVFYHSASDKITITILQLEAPYESVKCTAIAANDVSIPITRCGFCFATHHNPTVSDKVFICPKNEPNMSLVAYLQPNQQYYVRAFAERAYGTAYSQERSITTGNVDEIDGYQYIDLGLPSGLKWAKWNVGATSKEEAGLYFAWGDTVGYTGDVTDGHLFDWVHYKWCRGTSSSMTKYCTVSRFGTVDGKKTLELADDAAHAKWGGRWRMPTITELHELVDNCTAIEDTINNVAGITFTSTINGASVFFPKVGIREDAARYFGHKYWSSSLYIDEKDSYTSYSYEAFVLYLSSPKTFNFIYRESRMDGVPVRAVCK